MYNTTNKKFIQINLHKSTSSTLVIVEHPVENDVDIDFIQELYVIENTISLFQLISK